MKKTDEIKEIIGLSTKFNKTIIKLEKGLAIQTEILRQINDQNKLHKQALDVNTIATKEMTKSFNKIWYIFWAIVLALIVLAVGEKFIKFMPFLKF